MSNVIKIMLGIRQNRGRLAVLHALLCWEGGTFGIPHARRNQATLLEFMDDQLLFCSKTIEKPKTFHALIAMLSGKDLSEKIRRAEKTQSWGQLCL